VLYKSKRSGLRKPTFSVRLADTAVFAIDIDNARAIADDGACSTRTPIEAASRSRVVARTQSRDRQALRREIVDSLHCPVIDTSPVTLFVPRQRVALITMICNFTLCRWRSVIERNIHIIGSVCRGDLWASGGYKSGIIGLYPPSPLTVAVAPNRIEPYNEDESQLIIMYFVAQVSSLGTTTDLGHLSCQHEKNVLRSTFTAKSCPRKL